MAALRAFARSPYGALTALTLLVFAQVLAFDFVNFDDDLLVYDNPTVTEGRVAKAFMSYDPELYVPLTLLSYQIEYAIFGDLPLPFHFSNLLLHVANVLLAFWCCSMLMRSRSAAFLAAAIFAVHPLQVEVVSWVAARKDLLSALFFFAGVGFYLRAKGEAGSPLWWRSAGAFLLGLLSKVTVVTMLPVLLLIDWLQGRFSKYRIAEKWPFFVLAVLFGIIAVIGKQSNLQSISFLQMLLFSVKAAGVALWHVVFPANLTVFYQQHEPIDVLQIWPWALCCGIYLLLVVLALRRSRVASFGLLLFAVTFAPSLATFQKNGLFFFASDRYTYIGLLGIGIAAGTLMAAIAMRGRKVAFVVSTLLVAGLSGLSFVQARHWQSSETLYSRVLQYDDRSLMAQNNLGVYFKSKGDMQTAEQYFQAAIALDPTAPAPLTNLGLIAMDQNERGKALELFLRAADGQEAHNRPVASEDLAPYFLAADIYSSRGDLPRAISLLRRAVERGPHIVDAHVNLGILLQKSQRYEDARIALEAAIALQPDHIDALYRLASVYGELGMLPEAESALERVIHINPTYEKAQLHLLNIRSAGGRRGG
jgi:tetratricopeptide (TPR) repeat protein